MNLSLSEFDFKCLVFYWYHRSGLAKRVFLGRLQWCCDHNINFLRLFAKVKVLYQGRERDGVCSIVPEVYYDKQLFASVKIPEKKRTYRELCWEIEKRIIAMIRG